MDKDEISNVYVDHGKYSGFGYSTVSAGSFDHHDGQQHHDQLQVLMKPVVMDEHEHDDDIEASTNQSNNQMVDYMLNQPTHDQASRPGLMSFADVMQLADHLGPPNLAPPPLNQTKLATVVDHDGTGIHPIDFLKFPVLNDKIQMVDHDDQSDLMVFKSQEEIHISGDNIVSEEKVAGKLDIDKGCSSMHQQLLANIQSPTGGESTKGKRKRPRTIKTSQEVESQRMTHIAVERNRRKQMNEHLRVLRSLMPGSYVQRGDQASIIGGAIEFVRELEQLLQCLESQKRRRLYGDLPTQPAGAPVVDPSSSSPGHQAPFAGAPIVSQQTGAPHQLVFPNPDQLRLMELEAGLQEEVAESKSCLADVEVKMLGIDAMIKILSRRRPGQLTKAIEALEEHLQMNILHTNITTMDQTVLYSFNVKVGSEAMFTAEDIASSVQQIFGFIHTNSLE